MAINRVPFLNIMGITSVSDGNNLVQSLIQGGVPLSLQKTGGGYSQTLYLPPGQSSLLSLFPGPITADDLNMNSLWLLEFGFSEPLTNRVIYTEPGSFAANALNALLVQIYAFKCNQNYILDTASIAGLVLENSSALSNVYIRVWELYIQ